MDRAAASAHRISYVTENRLRRLRPAADIRAGLAARDPNLQRTGMSVWLARRDCRGTSAQHSARRWHIGAAR